MLGSFQTYSAVTQLHTYTRILFCILHYTVLKDIEYNSLCYTEDPYWLSIHSKVDLLIPNS